jgi:hypothetical protein
LLYILTEIFMSTYLVTIEGVEIAPGSAQSVVFDGALPKYVSVMVDSGLISLRLLTDVQGVVLIDPATGLPYVATGGGGGGATDVSALNRETTQASVLTALNSIDTDIGSPSVAVATSDTGTFSLIALVKRGLQNWTTLLSRLPALASGRIPTDGSGVTQPVSAVSRACVGAQTINLTAGVVSTLNVAVGAAAAQIQADGNTVRITQDGSVPSATIGTRIDDGVIYYVDTSLAAVKLFAPVACSARVVYFDRA